MTSLGITLLTALQSLQALGIETDGILGGQANGARHEWADVVRTMERISTRLPAHQYGTFAADWLCRHPTFRAASRFAAGPVSWTELLWKLATLVNPAVECHYAASPTGHRLTARLKKGERPSRLWFELMHHWAVQAPVMLCADALPVRAVEVTDSSLEGHYGPPEPTSSVMRIDRATRIPLRTIFSSLRALEPKRLQRFHDGHQRTGRSAERSSTSREHFSRRFSLTPREHEVLMSLADGLLPAEVARELSISVMTARVHLKRIYAKTATSGQREVLAKLAAERLA